MVNSDSLDAVFSALSDPTRRRILERLARSALTIGELGAEFPISQPAISKHVRVLESSGLLKREIVGRIHRCTLSPHAMQSASAWLEKQRRFWDATLDRLGDVLNAQSGEKKK
jgi:DNA-binding transcriptional ArsR family regulator